MTKALVLTNHLMEWAGSEVLAVEVSELLSARFAVTLCGNQVSPGLQGWAKKSAIRLVDDPSNVDLFEFDFIWSQHSLAPLCKNFENLKNYKGVFNSVHLSPYEPLELAALMYVNSGVNSILANSEETKKAIEGVLGDGAEIINFNNAAPPEFRNSHPSTIVGKTLQNLLVVSNHIPSEMMKALQFLEREGVQVGVFGMGTPNYRRITSQDIENFDAVVSIGKTVQYGILGRKPVYCYDRFGGPGWINTLNYEEALRYNFSGRCCNTKKSALQIASELIGEFEEANSTVNYLYDSCYKKFDLASLLCKLETSNKKVLIQGAKNPFKHSSEVIRRMFIANRAVVTRMNELERSMG